MKKSISSYALIFLMLVQAVSAVPVGWSLINDPSGHNLGLEIEALNRSPFSNFLIPGLFLFIVLGIIPLLALYGLISKFELKIADNINMHKNYHWSWTLSYYVGLLLIFWINLQLLFIREFHILHFIYSTIGVLIIITTLLPSTKRDYERP